MKYRLTKIIIVSVLLSSTFIGASQLTGTDTTVIKISQQKTTPKPYPLKVCIVSDEELGSMGDPVALIYKDQLFKLCCKTCIKTFKKNPEKYLKLLAVKIKEKSK